jgi:tryptophanyl-tRNA synthetase
MSKSRGNVIELGMTADETAKVIKKAVTDSDRHITYDPANRPEVSNLVNLAALFLKRNPVDVAEELGDAGGGGLKKLVTEAVNEGLAGHRARRAELVADPAHLHQILAERQRPLRTPSTADATRLAEVWTYGDGGRDVRRKPKNFAPAALIHALRRLREAG